MTFEQYLAQLQEVCRQEGYDSLDETCEAHLRARFYKNPVRIGEGKRIYLRELVLSDLEKIYDFADAGEEEVLDAFLKESYASSKEHLEAYISHMYPMYDYGIWAVEEKESGMLLGLCGLGRTEINKERCTDLGYYIRPEKRSCGLASEAIEIVLDYVKNYLEFPLIYAIIKEENRISANILEKFGFVLIQREKNELVFQKVF